MKASGNSSDPSFTPPSAKSMEHSPTSRPASEYEDMLVVEVSPKKDNTRKKDLKVFDFDLSGDEDDMSQAGSSLKKAKVNHRGSHQSRQPAISKKQTLLHQYMGAQSTTSSSSRGVIKKNKDVAAVKTNDGASRKQTSTSSSKRSQAAADLSVRNTISKLLASKAEELATKASNQERQEGYTDQESSASTTSATWLGEAAATVSEESGGSITRRTKRRNPLTTTAAAAKKAPPKRARMEREEDPEEVFLDSVDLLDSPSSSSQQQSESSQTKQSEVKKNGLRGTLDKSEIALRTRSSRKSQGQGTRNEDTDQKAEDLKLKGVDDASFSDSQPSSITESDVYSPSHQETDLGLMESPKSTMLSNSEMSRGSRPSPRYTVRGRRMSNLTPDVKSEHATAAASVVSGPKVGVRQTTAKQASDREHESDPYSLDEDSAMDKGYLKKQHLIPPVSSTALILLTTV